MDNTIDMQAEKKDQGFTLVELLIVIVILGILATVTVFAVRGITDQGKTSACEADQKTLETAAETYFAQYGSAAGIPAGSDPAPANVTWSVGATESETLVNAGFLRSVSAKFTVDSTGALTAVAGSGCTV